MQSIKQRQKIFLPSKNYPCWATARKDEGEQLPKWGGTWDPGRWAQNGETGTWHMASYNNISQCFQDISMMAWPSKQLYGTKKSVSVWRFMTGLFEIWRFSCISKKALINSLVGRNVSWDYLVQGCSYQQGSLIDFLVCTDVCKCIVTRQSRIIPVEFLILVL